MNHAVVISMPLLRKTVSQVLHVCIVLIFKSTKQWQICLYTLTWLCMWLLFAKLNWDTGLISDRFRVITLLLSLEFTVYPFQVNISASWCSCGYDSGLHRKTIQRKSPRSTVSSNVFWGYVFSASWWQYVHSEMRKIKYRHSYTAWNNDFKTFLLLNYLFKRKKIDIHVSKKALKTVTPNTTTI